MRVDNHHFTNLDDALGQLAHWQVVSDDSAQYLIQVFAALPTGDARALASELKRVFPHSVVLGMSTNNGLCLGKLFEAPIVVSLLRLEHTQLVGGLHTISPETATSDVNALVKEVHRQDCKAIISFAHGIDASHQHMFAGAREHCSVPIVGGIADHSKEAQGPWVMLDTHVSANTIVAVTLNSQQLQVWQRAFLEWIPIGREMTVTHSDGHRLYSLDNEPVIEAYSRYFSVDGHCQFEVCQDFPIYCRTQGDMVYSAPVSLYEDGSMQMTEVLPQGEKVQFSYFHPNLSKSRIREELRGMHEQLPEAIFLYNCASRVFNGDGSIEEEVEVFEQLAPSAGAYCFGEFSAEPEQRIAHHSVTYLGLAETPRTRAVDQPEFSQHRPVDRSLSPLFSLINQAFIDLAQLNANLEQQVGEKSRALISSIQQHRLTGLPNRSQMNTQLAPYKKLRGIVVIKLCNLGWINHGAGDHFGDQAVTWVAHQIDQFCEQRWGNDYVLLQLSSSEWLLAVCCQTSQKAMRSDLIELISGIESQRCPLRKGRELHHTNVVLKAGVAVQSNGLMPQSEVKLNRLLHRAKQARRDALSGNQVVCFYRPTDTLIADPSQAMMAIEIVKNALEQGGVEIFGQPIFEQGTRQIASVECLVRIRDGEGFLPPGIFLPAISQTNLYSELSREIIRLSIAQMDSQGLRYSINVAPQDLFNDETFACLLAQIKAAKQPELIGIEVLESEQIRDYEAFAKKLSQLSELHARVIIDDFGSGYSNLNEILKLKPQIVKLDGSLVRDMDTDPQQRLMVEHFNNLCQAMNIRTTAEFVRNQAICEIVESIGVDYLQGFYLAEPQPLAQLLEQYT
ncbi:EAL domain-containing protein [Corallincola platygyrae]|uniref:EAL domain-containing protein n=1 Tax=Corallincola platygyrae TaxID=1193278 RepID=A0ABW4XSG0_9GAMM